MKIEKLSTNRVKFTFTVTTNEFDHALDYAFNQVKDSVEVKGFRKGHVPRNIYENHFGVESLFEEALNHVFHHKFHEALTNKEYQIVGDPKPIVNLEDVKVGSEFTVALECAIKPEVELGEYKGIEVKKLSDEVTNEEVEARIEGLMANNITLEIKEDGTLEEGDTAIFDFEGFHNGEAFEGGKAENFELEIGSNQFIPGFESQMVGMTVGEEKDLNVTFPEEYHAEHLAGEEVVFKVKLHEIKVKVKPELTDEWVATLNREEKTVEALKEALENEIKLEKQHQNKNLSLDEALKKIADNTKVDIPEEMVEYEVRQAFKNIENQAAQYGLDLETYISLTGMQEEELRFQVRLESAQRILNSLIIEAIAKKEKFEVSNEEIENRYQELSEMYNIPVEEVKTHLAEDLLKSDIEFSKAVDFIYDNLKFV